MQISTAASTDAAITGADSAHDQPLDQRPFLSSLKAMIGLCFVVMLVALDQTVVGTALPTIVVELKGFELYAWVTTSYLLTSMITVPIIGRLGDYFGRKYFVLASIAVFILASLLCGLAHSMLFLVLARGLQGIGGGMLLGTVFACVSDLFPDVRERIRWRLMLSVGFGISNAIGPSLGGLLTQWCGWRSIFYVNLPIGLLSLWCVSKYMPTIRQIKHAGSIRLDWPGALLIVATLVTFQVFIEIIPSVSTHLALILLPLLSIVAFYFLVQWEKHFSHPIVPLNMFRNPALSALFLLSSLSGFLQFGLLIYVPLLFQGGFGMSPAAAGLLLTPFVVSVSISSIIGGRLLTRIANPKRLLYLGFSCSIIAVVGIFLTRSSTPQWLVVIYLMVAGLGQGFVNPTSVIFVQEIASRTEQGIATAMVQSSRMVGAMVGTAVIGTFVHFYYAAHVNQVLFSHLSSAWLSVVTNPQFLADSTQQASFLGRAGAGLGAADYLSTIRATLVTALHFGQMLSIAVALTALWQVGRVPIIEFKIQK